MTATPFTSGSAVKVQVCALRYLPQADPGMQDGFVILYALKNASVLRLYIHHGFRPLVSEADREYIDELLTDLRHRCERDPEELFVQLCNLNVGPVVTDAIDVYQNCEPNLGAAFEPFTDPCEDLLKEAV